MNNIYSLYQTPTIKALEKLALEQAQLTEDILMDRAGHAALKCLKHYWSKAQKIIVICGKGNNGGDGYVLARLAHHAGIKVIVYQLVMPDQLKGAALNAAKACEHDKITMHLFDGQLFSEDILSTDVVVDALLGTGITTEVQEVYRNAIMAINALQLPVLSLDVPSGLNANTGAILGVAVNAKATATFLGAKTGLFTASGPAYSGEVYLDDLQVPANIFAQVNPQANLIHASEINHYLPRRREDVNKANFGHVLVIGSDYGMAGAVRMAGEAAARVGAGLVSVATHPEHVDVVSVVRPELMCYGIRNKKELQPLLEKATVIILGPGLGQSEWSEEMFRAALLAPQPKIIDADGLNWLAKNPQQQNNWILTPHPGEAGRLLKTETAAIQNDRFQAAFDLQERYQGVIVLKGSGTLVQAPTKITGICAAGNPGMASGGMGDVLSGVIGGLLAQGLTLEAAARIGVFVHSQAADRAALEGGQRGLLALDLMPYLQRLVNPY